MPDINRANTRRYQNRPEVQAAKGQIPSTNPEDFQMTEEQQQDFFEQLVKMISTQQQLAANRAGELDAFNRASPATMRATQRGINYQGAMAAEQGGFDLNKWIMQYNREGTQIANQNWFMRQQLRLQKDAQDQNFWDQLLGLMSPAVQGYGYAMGSKPPNTYNYY